MGCDWCGAGFMVNRLPPATAIHGKTIRGTKTKE